MCVLKKIFLCIGWILILGFFISGRASQELQISAEILQGPCVRIKLKDFPGSHPQGLILIRSTHPLSKDTLDPVRYPITRYRLSSEDLSSGFVDAAVAHNVTYTYLLAPAVLGSNGSWISEAVSLSIPDVALPALYEPSILIDKTHYLLEVWDLGALQKKYPIILGRDPVIRKLHQDFQTTPEGIYRITNRKRVSTFRHALDIDYPNAVDRLRYAFLRAQGRVPEGKAIGGEIQIHGQLRSWALERNWTWGCIALRNQDIDELFDRNEIRVGTQVFIVGEQITRFDLEALRTFRSVEDLKRLQASLKGLSFYSGPVDGKMGPQTRYALGRYQIDMGFPVTCDLDARTMIGLAGSALPHKKAGDCLPGSGTRVPGGSRLFSEQRF